MHERASTTGWVRVAFGDVVRLSRVRSADPARDGYHRYVGLEHIEPNALTICRWGRVVDGTTFTNVFRQGQTLFGKRRAYQRKIALADFDGVCSGDIYVLEARDANLLPQLLPFLCQSDDFFAHAVGTSAGSLSPRTNWESLAKYEFYLPPIEEQREILTLLAASEQYRETLGALLNAHTNLRASALEDLTTEDGGVLRSFGEFCSMQNGRPFPGAEYQTSGLRLLRPGNMNISGYLSWEDYKTAHLAPRWADEAKEFRIEGGDVLINLTAQSLEEGFLGRVCLADEKDVGCLLNQRIGRFVGWSDELLPEYAFRVLQSARFQRHVVAMAEGSKVKHLFWSNINVFNVRLPALAKQRESVDTLRDLDTVGEHLRLRLASQRILHHQILEATLNVTQQSSGPRS